MTFNENGQQQVASNNAELQTKWMKVTRKTYKETIRRGQNESIEAQLMKDDDNYENLN